MIFKHYLLVFRKKWFTESLTNVLTVIIYIIYKILNCMHYCYYDFSSKVFKCCKPVKCTQVGTGFPKQ